ncbi:RNA polymerase sigma factor [Pedobacter endophyticus]|uniref:RNA polymerase sigma-70 factor n=1 Tax=Pedobacter endophyticus TaxID=2789740 RepID=A0A7S9Q0P5_9SPHI|nr:RNA polymerase sigma-70 factor [Pedobacter endophyticus]QPH40927.1 RNA polymerase sigma-70 factor [Pedobacter endophyticus]
MNNYSERSEKELIELLKQDDQGAFSRLYFQNIQKLKYFIQRTTKSPHLAEDIVHDTFVKLWESRKEIDAAKPLKPYLYTIAKRTLLNVLKRANHEVSIITEIRKYAQETENTTDLEIEYNESNSLMVDALNSITGQPKEVFIRCRIQGLTYKQAAEELGVTESTVNKHMHKALKLIREYIKYKNALAVLLALITVHK